MPPRSLSSLNQLRGMLNRGERVTLDRAAEKVGVSRRQVRRLLKTIADEGHEIQETFVNGVKHFRLGPHDRRVDTTLTLSEKELEALTVANPCRSVRFGSYAFQWWTAGCSHNPSPTCR